MRKIAVIHQPNFLPWIGYFYKMMKSDIFIFLDDVQYVKRSLVNRNKIKTSQGELYIRLPLFQKGKYKQLINECKLHNKEDSFKIFVRTIDANYSKSKYFKNYFADICDILNQNIDNLVDLNILFVEWILNILGVKVDFKKSSELNNINGTSTEKLVSICKEVGANEYLSGFGGAKYQDETIFKKANIKLTITDFEHPVYEQLWGEFVPNLSVIDLIFNEGPDSKNIILNAN